MNIRDSYIHGKDGKGVVKFLYFATGVESVLKADGSANYNTAAAKDLILLLADATGTKVGLPIPTLNQNTSGYAALILTQNKSENKNYSLTFVDGSNNTATPESLYTNNGIYFNPTTGPSGHTGTLYVKNISGDNIGITIGNTFVALGGTYSPNTSITSSSDNNSVPGCKAVWDAILTGIQTNDAMVFKGLLIGGADAANTAYTPSADRGDTYKVGTAGYINGEYYQVNDTFICTKDETAAATSSTSAANMATIKANWAVVEGNGDYLSIHGGTMYGQLKWNNSDALPQLTSPQYFLVLDAFADGGTTKWANLLDTRNALGASQFIGTCTTAADTAAKVATVEGLQTFQLQKGTIVSIKFSKTNTASSCTLNVNNTGAKQIYFNNAVYTGSSNQVCGYANRYYTYIYDGTYWVWVNHGVEENTTYSAGTADLIQAGTNTSNRVWQAKILQDEFVSARGDTMTGPLVINSSVNNLYNEGIRITRASNNWAGITFGSTGAAGAPTGGWFAATNPSNQFIINPDDSSGTAGLQLNKGGNLKWRNNIVAHAGNITSSDATLTTSLTTIATIAGVEIQAKITNYNTDNTAVKLGTAGTTSITNGSKISVASSTGITFEGGTNAFKVGNGTNSITVPVSHGLSTKNLTANDKAYAIYTSASSLPNLDTIYTKHTRAIPYIVGPSTDTTAGTWTGTCDEIGDYVDGLTIIYVPAVAGASTTTLNINNKGAKTCYVTNTNKLTTHFAVGTPIMFTYKGGYWMRADYDSNSNTWRNIYTGGTSRVGTGTGTKAMNFATTNLNINYLAAGTGTGQSSSPDYFTIRLDAKNWTGATSSAAGTAGYMPGAATADKNKFLRGDGTWVALAPSISAGTNDTNKIKITVGEEDSSEFTVPYATKAAGAEYLINYSSDNDPAKAKLDQKVKWFAQVNSTTSGSTGYAGNNYGFPVSNNANGILWLGTHSGNYGGQLGISSNGYIYYRFISGGTFPTTANGGSWKRVAFTSELSNTWRGIYTGGTSRVGTGTNTKAMNFAVAGNLSVDYLAAGANTGQSGSPDYFTVKITASANAAGKAGYVAAPSATDDKNKVWMTGSDGAPAWRTINVSTAATLLVKVTKALAVNDWTNMAAVSTYSGTYAIQINNGNLYASGIFSVCGGTDAITDEIPLHVSSTSATWRPYARISAGQLQMTTNEDTGTNRDYTIKILKLI